MNYQDEIEWLVTNPKRNNFIKNLALSLKGNSILFFQFVDKHGKVLYDLIKQECGDRPVFFISGEVEGEERNEIRGIVEDLNDAIIVASYGTSSTGINIRKIRNLVFTSPSKSRVRVLQSIGRGLRLSKDDAVVTVYDIADDLIWKSKENHTIKHYKERVKIYNEEQFDYKIYNVNL
jgi:superfamily II DNA or RNA helicase